MTPLAWGLVGIAALAAVVDWAALARDNAPIERITKPAVLLALIAAAVVAAPAAGVGTRPWLVAALVASLAGDVLLLPPGRFVAGLVAFLVAQLAYLVAFAQLPGSVPGVLVGAALALALIATVGRVIVPAARRVGLAAPVAVYLAAICGMAIAATRTGLPVAVAGAWLFVASDATLGWDRFAAPEPPTPRDAAIRRLAVIVPYHLGQALLLVALVG